VEANVGEAHDTPVTIRSCVSEHRGSPEMARKIKFETHNIVAAVQKLLQGDPVSLLLPYERGQRIDDLLQDPSEHFRAT